MKIINIIAIAGLFTGMCSLCSLIENIYIQFYFAASLGWMFGDIFDILDNHYKDRYKIK